MSWHRENYRTTVAGILAAASTILPVIVPGVGPICAAAQAMFTAIFGYLAADGKNITG